MRTHLSNLTPTIVPRTPSTLPYSPLLTVQILSSPGDVAQLSLLYKMTRELARRMPAYRGEVAAHHPKFSPSSPAACSQTDGPVPMDAPDIVYSDADDEAIAKFIRDTGQLSLSDCARFIAETFPAS